METGTAAGSIGGSRCRGGLTSTLACLQGELALGDFLVHGTTPALAKYFSDAIARLEPRPEWLSMPVDVIGLVTRDQFIRDHLSDLREGLRQAILLHIDSDFLTGIATVNRIRFPACLGSRCTWRCCSNQLLLVWTLLASVVVV